MINKVVDEVLLPAAKWWLTEGLCMAVVMKVFGDRRARRQKHRRLTNESKRFKRFCDGKGEEWDRKCLEEFEEQLAWVVGLKPLKEQLRCWARGMVMDRRRQAAGLTKGQRRLPHLLFMGSPGTGKTTVARLLGRLLYNMGMLEKDTVVEVQRTDLVGQYVGHTGPKTRKVIESARGGILFIDELYRLMPTGDMGTDFGKEALEEIMSAMESDDLVIIFAGYEKPLKLLMEANEGFHRRVAAKLLFPDLTVKEVAEVMALRMKEEEAGGPSNGFKFDSKCTVEAMAELLGRHIPQELLKKANGGVANMVLTAAREQLDKRLDLSCNDVDELSTIKLEDIEEAVKTMAEREVDSAGESFSAMYL